MEYVRRGGARREASDRVRFVVEGRSIDGWALNLSEGGVRAVVDEPIELGAQVEVGIGDGELRAAQIVWIQEERDGAIVGVEFKDGTGPVPQPSEPPAGPGPG